MKRRDFLVGATAMMTAGYAANEVGVFNSLEAAGYLASLEKELHECRTLKEGLLVLKREAVSGKYEIQTAFATKDRAARNSSDGIWMVEIKGDNYSVKPGDKVQEFVRNAKSQGYVSFLDYHTHPQDIERKGPNPVSYPPSFDDRFSGSDAVAAEALSYDLDDVQLGMRALDAYGVWKYKVNRMHPYWTRLSLLDIGFSRLKTDLGEYPEFKKLAVKYADQSPSIFLRSVVNDIGTKLDLSLSGACMELARDYDKLMSDYEEQRQKRDSARENLMITSSARGRVSFIELQQAMAGMGVEIDFMTYKQMGL